MLGDVLRETRDNSKWRGDYNKTAKNGEAKDKNCMKQKENGKK